MTIARLWRAARTALYRRADIAIADARTSVAATRGAIAAAWPGGWKLLTAEEAGALRDAGATFGAVPLDGQRCPCGSDATKLHVDVTDHGNVVSCEHCEETKA